MYEQYIIQGLMSGAIICYESSVGDECVALKEADKLLKDPTFEGDSVRVITRDSELVWESKTI